MTKKRKSKRRDTAAQELWNPKYRMKVCRDRTKYHRKEKYSGGRYDSGSFFGWIFNALPVATGNFPE